MARPKKNVEATEIVPVEKKKRGRKKKEVIDVTELSTLAEDITIVEEVKKEPKILSEQAAKWKAWLKLHGLTPQQFLLKYTKHPSRMYVEELLED